MMKGLETCCEDLREQIDANYDIGPGDARDLFSLIWQNLTAAFTTGEVADAISLVAETFDIG